MFYDISAKRYCLYQNENKDNQLDRGKNQDKNDNINILKYFTHGLGHLKDIDGEQTRTKAL